MSEPLLSACLIVKNEERFLAQCLSSLENVVDEVVVVDTGSTDSTKSIALKFGARLFDFPWNGSFSAARNKSLKLARGQWILYINADESLRPCKRSRLKALLGNSS